MLLVLITSIGCNISAQNFENKQIRDFLVSVGEVQEGSRCSYYAYELLTSNMMKPSDSCGIFRIGVHTSHSYTYLLLLGKQGKNFLDCHTNLYQTLSTVLSFFENSSCHFSDSEKLSYIKEIMDVYHRNKVAIPW